jgi:molybdopterin-biosynthesis enzyme MoeA-like protein
VTHDDTTMEQIATVELARLRRVEKAAKQLLEQMQGRRSATTVLTAVAELRAALKEPS